MTKKSKQKYMKNEIDVKKERMWNERTKKNKKDCFHQNQSNKHWCTSLARKYRDCFCINMERYFILIISDMLVMVV